jgi:putative inorganic carbon (HCO3(-)) transporter
MIIAFASPDAFDAVSLSLRAVALYGAVVIGAALSLLWRAEIGIYILTVILPLQTTRYHLHRFLLGANIVDILLLCTLVGYLMRRPHGPPGKSTTLRFLALLGFFYYLSLWRGAFYLGTGLPLWFDDPRLVDFKNFMVMLLLALATFLVIRTRKQMMVILALCALTVMVVDYSYFKGSLGRDFAHYSEATRDAGPLGYAGENGLASYLVEMAACLIPFLALRSVRAKLFVALVLTATTICILYSYSREAYIALALALCFVAILRVRWLIIPILALAFSWHTILPTAVTERVAMTYTNADEGEHAKLDASAQERIMLWSDAVELFKEHPLMGSGFLTYADMHRVGSYRDTHNFYLKMLVETGLIGVGLFVLQLALLFTEGIKLFRRSQDSFLSLLGLGFAALILCAAVVNFFGDRWMFIQVSSNLWILLGCTVRARTLEPAIESKPQIPAHRFSWEPGSSLPAPRSPLMATRTTQFYLRNVEDQ